MLMNIVVPEVPGVMFKTCEPGYLACHPQTNCKLLISPESLCSFYVLRGGGVTTPLHVIGQAFNQSEQGNG